MGIRYSRHGGSDTVVVLSSSIGFDDHGLDHSIIANDGMVIVVDSSDERR
jgi:hypothetical protein